jgi:osmotically-inducible protein OsmY
MRKHRDLQNSVLETIKWEPLLAEAEIYVTQKDGVITLTGTVDSYVKKLGAICAAKSVAGVKDVVEKIEIKLDHRLKATMILLPKY